MSYPVDSCIQVVYMASKVISFRFSDAEIEALQALQLPEDDSLNQTAARLVRERFTRVEPPQPPLSTNVDIKELVKQEIEASLNQVRSQLEAQLEELRGKLIAR